jgi:xanthine dehydrogenase molybdopterin-binding subunit B
MIIRFEELLFDTPECNDFRRLADGSWVAYSTRADENGQAIRHAAPTIREALEGIQAKLK